MVPRRRLVEDARDRARRAGAEQILRGRIRRAGVGAVDALLDDGAWLYFVAQWRRCAIPEMGSSITELRFVKKLGRGTFGEVVQVQHKNTSEYLAMKYGIIKDSTVKRLQGEGGDEEGDEPHALARRGEAQVEEARDEHQLLLQSVSYTHLRAH